LSGWACFDVDQCADWQNAMPVSGGQARRYRARFDVGSLLDVPTRSRMIVRPRSNAVNQSCQQTYNSSRAPRLSHTRTVGPPLFNRCDLYWLSFRLRQTPPRAMPTKNITASNAAIAPSFRGALSLPICLSKSSRSYRSIFTSPIFVDTKRNKTDTVPLIVGNN
jgi:hypothetical protein